MTTLDLSSSIASYEFECTPVEHQATDPLAFVLRLQRYLQEDHSFRWAIERDGGGYVWTREGCFEYQGMPSCRKDDFFERARWQFDEAVAEVERILPHYRAWIASGRRGAFEVLR